MRQKWEKRKWKIHYHYKLSFEGIDVGKDSKYPVTPAYADQGEFEFKGELVKVEYHLGDDAEFIIPRAN